LFILIGLWAVLYPLNVGRRQRLKEKKIRELDEIREWAENIEKCSEENTDQFLSDKYKGISSNMLHMLNIASNHGDEIHHNVFDIMYDLTKLLELEAESTGDISVVGTKAFPIDISISCNATKLIERTILAKKEY